MKVLLWSLPTWLVVVTLVAPLLVRRWGRQAGYPIGAGLALPAVALAVSGPRVLDQSTSVAIPWIPRLGAQLAFHLDALSLVFGLLILGIGALVLWFSPSYLSHGGNHGRYYTALAGFAAAMTTLVLADDLILLYVAWEATTIASVVLIALERQGRAPAVRALVLNVAGGFALLAASLLALAVVGDVAVHELARPDRWPSGAAAFLGLLLVASAVKSAQPPFHPWLPDAMVAPTPVSAYLHAAAMVKAGVYLLLRFAELIASEPTIAVATVLLGAVAAAFGAAAATRRNDLKELLAYSTISQLGFIVALIGVGTEVAIAAAIVHVIAHALYKSGLFLVTGVADHALGTRDLGVLDGARRVLPIASGGALLCAASMAGLPPMLGFVSKEEALKSLTKDLGGVLGGAWLLGLALVIVALILTVAYSIRVAVPFATAGQSGSRKPADMSVVPALLGVLGLAAGLFSARLTDPIRRATAAALGIPLEGDLGLWHGATTAFWTSSAILGAGLITWLALRHRQPARPATFPLQTGARAVGRLLVRGGALIDRPLHEPSPAFHLGIVGAVTGSVLVVGAVASAGSGPGSEGLSPRWVVAVLLVVSAVAASRARNRLAAVAVVAVTGFLVAAFYVLHGAADLVLTQLVVDALTVALIVFVFRDLPPSYPATSTRRAVVAAGLAVLVGTGLGTVAYFASGNAPPEVAIHYLEKAPGEGADNVVNAILTDYRALDTLAETAVLATAAIGVVVVIRTRGRQGT